MLTMSGSTPILSPRGNWRGARVAVLGLGRSGIAAAGLLMDEGCTVLLLDDGEPRLPRTLLQAIEEGTHRLSTGASAREVSALEGLDALVVSPGVGGDHPLIEAAEKAHIPVWSELEVASRRVDGPMILVTGTNGKSTTVSLIHHLLQTAHRNSLLAGNIGTALSGVVDQAGPDTITVVEASSFQLERIETLHPAVAVLLNLAPDHLDRYGDFDAYVSAKRRMLENLDDEDSFVFPAGDATAETWSAVCSSRKLRFQPSPIAAGEEDGTGALLPFSLPLEALQRGLRSFRGLEHRVESVGSIDGVRYVNDSKATNVHAATAALRGLEGPIVLLLGGRGKGEDYSALRESMEKVVAVVCYGEEGERLGRSLEGVVTVHRAGTMIEAAERARELARRGDTVLLSPACTSYDEFRSFEERGQRFKQWVREHGGGVQ